MKAHAATVLKNVIRVISEVSGFAKYGFTVSACPVDKLVECFSHAYYRVFMLNSFSVITYMAECGENIASDVFLIVFFFLNHGQNKRFPFFKTVGRNVSFSLATLNYINRDEMFRKVNQISCLKPFFAA